MRPGLIMNGRCVMAPSALDLSRPGDLAFASKSGGLIVTVDGAQPGFLRAYDERAGTVDILRDGADVVRLTGDVRAYPAS